MKVLHVYRTYFPDPPGGLQEAIRQICLATAAHGVDNTVFTLSPNPEPREIRFEEALVVRERSWAAPASCDLGGPAAFRRFRALVEEADVVHYLFPWPFADLLAESVGAMKPSVVTYVSDVVRQRILGTLYRPLMSRLLARASAIVANSPGYAASSAVLSRPGIREKVTVVPLGIVDSDRRIVPDRTVLERLGVEHDTYFLFVGVLRYYKGLEFLVRASTCVHVPIVVAGDGPERSRLEDLVRELGISNVRFAGFVTDAEKAALLDGCLALVLPSHLRSEAFGMVLVEAAMRGKPLISTELGTGTSFVNENGVSGLVVAPRDPCALAEALALLADDSKRRAGFAAAARARYEERFSGPALGAAYTRLFEGACARQPRG